MIFAQDNDDGNAKSGSNKGIKAAAEQLKEQGITVYGAKPDLLPGELTTDFNDVQQTKGVEGVKEALENPNVLAAPEYTPEIPTNIETKEQEVPDFQIPLDAYSEHDLEMEASGIPLEIEPDMQFEDKGLEF